MACSIELHRLLLTGSLPRSLFEVVYLNERCVILDSYAQHYAAGIQSFPAQQFDGVKRPLKCFAEAEGFRLGRGEGNSGWRILVVNPSTIRIHSIETEDGIIY